MIPKRLKPGPRVKAVIREVRVPEDIWPRRRDWKGQVVAILVKEGDTVNEGKVVAEVEIEKAVLRIESPYGGKVKEIRVRERQNVSPGDSLAVLEVE